MPRVILTLIDQAAAVVMVAMRQASLDIFCGWCRMKWNQTYVFAIRNTNCESTYNSLDNYTFPAPFISTTPAPKSTSENNNDSFQRCEGTERYATISTSGEGVCHHCESPSREDLKICWWLTTLQLMHHGLLRDTGHQRVLAGNGSTRQMLGHCCRLIAI